MQDLITHLPFHVRDQIFWSPSLCASRVHNATIQINPQPAHSGTHISVWLDGELYNQNQLRLLLPDAPPHINDAELLARLCSHYDKLEFLRDIDGIFSAAIFDSARRRVRLITDRYGLRHLYWLTCGGDLAWSSEPKAFLAVNGFAPTLSHDAVNEFFEFGYLLENRAWFQDVQLLTPGSVLEFDLETRAHYEWRYWSWDSIKPLGVIKEEDAVHELASRFSCAVARQSDASLGVGISLSGGLDSRALLAAIPEHGRTIHAVTFGKRHCDDIRIASEVARVKGAAHHIVELNEANWFDHRTAGVWLTDGQNDLGHMHALVSVLEQRKYYRINLNGYLGDAVLGGWYQDDPVWSLAEKIDNRGRRFINEGTRLTNNFVHNRLPFFDNRLMEFAYALPDEAKAQSHLYCRMLLATYPAFFQNIPWQKTGVPISRPQWWSSTVHYSNRIASKLLRESARIGVHFSSTREYSSYAEWIRRGKSRNEFERVLMNPHALFPQFISADTVRRVWNEHLRGADRSTGLFRALTFEFWLQQVFEGCHRPDFVESKVRQEEKIGSGESAETRFAST
jgi:asparagine synthase (glutamine-hydrolysing)